MSSWRDLLFLDWSERGAARARSLFVPTVAAVAVADLTGLSNADDAVKQLYDWERDRLFTLAKGLGVAAVGVVTTLLVDAVEKKSTDSVAVWLAAVFAVMLLLWAGFILTGLRRRAPIRCVGRADVLACTDEVGEGTRAFRLLGSARPAHEEQRRSRPSASATRQSDARDDRRPNS